MKSTFSLTWIIFWSCCIIFKTFKFLIYRVHSEFSFHSQNIALDDYPLGHNIYWYTPVYTVCSAIWSQNQYLINYLTSIFGNDSISSPYFKNMKRKNGWLRKNVQYVFTKSQLTWHYSLRCSWYRINLI